MFRSVETLRFFFLFLHYSEYNVRHTVWKQRRFRDIIVWPYCGIREEIIIMYSIVILYKWDFLQKNNTKPEKKDWKHYVIKPNLT